MRNFISPHVHVASLDSGSTIEHMIQREKELGTGYGIITDHGTLGSCLDYYEACKREGIKPILGVEGYFRDDECPILNEAGLIQPLIDERKKEIIKVRSAAGYLKYFHITIHVLDQPAYMALVRVLSRVAFTNREKHGSENKPIFTWKDLEELGNYNVVFCSSCLIGMVGRHLMVGKPELAERYYLRLKQIVKPGNFYVELFPHDCSQNWENAIIITLDDQSTIKLRDERKVLVDGERIRVKDLMRRKIVPEKFTLDGTFYYSELTPVEKKIVGVELKKGFYKNECTAYSPDGDLQKSMNRFMIELATKHHDPILISDDSHFAHPEDKLVQDCRLNQDGKDSWKFSESYHRMDSQEAAAHFYKTLGATEKQVEEWIENGYQWASRFDDFSLKFDMQLPTKFYEQHGDLLTHVRKLIAKHGRLDAKDPQMIARLVTELNMLASNGTVNLLPYFLPLEEVVDAYQDNGLLTGPGRGSAAGLLLTYLLGITHVNPLKYGLSLERFITLDRILAGTLPDIDQDLEDREFLVGKDGHSGWLSQRFGTDHVAQISTNTNLRLKSSVRDVHRALGTLTPEVELICKRLPTPPQGVNDYDFVFGKVDESGQMSKEIPGMLDSPALKEYIEKYPEEWKSVQRCLGTTRQKSRHASAFIFSNQPISNFIPMTLIGGIPCTEYTAKSVEKAGAIKTDFLVVNSLRDIRACLELVRQRQEPNLPEYFNLNGERVPRVRLFPAPATPNSAGTPLLDIWNLPEDQDVFKLICQGDTETVFQLNTSGAVRYLQLFNKDGEHLIRSIKDIAAFTSLDRPGPLDYQVTPGKNMLHEFVARKKGDVDRSSLAFSQYLYDTLPETMGILVYQEQAMKVAQDIGGFSPTESNDFRIYIGKKKQADLIAMKPKFIASATPKIGADEAERIWNMLVTFGGYAFNLSHAVCYSVTAYACAYLKYHHPLEWWCAVLQNASKNEVQSVFWRHCRHLVLPPDINQSKDTFVIEGDKVRSPVGLMDGIGPAIRDELVRKAPYQDIRDLLQRVNRRIVNRRVLLKLLISGVMDGLFQSTVFMEERYQQYQQARREVLGEDPEPLPIQYRNLLPLHLYCIRKNIIPTYICGQVPGELNFTQTFMGFAPRAALESVYGAKIAMDENGTRYMKFCRGRYEYKMVNPREFERLINDTSEVGNYALPAYVIEEKRFSYAQGTKEALKLTVDFDGVVTQLVKWPRRDDDHAVLEFEGKLEGSVVLLYVGRWKAGRDMSIEDVKWVCGVPEAPESKEES